MAHVPAVDLALLHENITHKQRNLDYILRPACAPGASLWVYALLATYYMPIVGKDDVIHKTGST